MPKRRNYPLELVEEAIRAKEAGLSYREVESKYGVPKSTIEFKLKHPGHRDTCGPATILRENEEQSLEKWILELARKGFPRKKEDIQSSVQRFLRDNPRANPFNNNRPGDGWFRAFLRRHPAIVQRTSEAVSSASACVSEANIRKWFQEIKSYIDERKLTDVIQDPCRVFNGDETGFQICPKTGKVYAQKGSKNVYTVDQGPSKECITVMFTFSASGETCVPMIVYPYKRIPDKIARSINPEWGIGRSDSGWMTAETFYEYIANVFYPYLVKNNILLPVILFVDGHKSHLSYELSVLSEKLQIEIIALYPNATRILQPADVAAFCPLKNAWRKSVQKWHTEHPDEILNKQSFAPLLEHAIQNGGIRTESLVNGFRVCGLCPFDANAVDYSKCLGKEIKRSEGNLDKTNKSLTYNDFLNIVGAEKIYQFEMKEIIGESSNNDDDFLHLYRIWQYFQSTTRQTIEPDSENYMLEMGNENNYQELAETEDPLEPNIYAEITEDSQKISAEPNITVIQNTVIRPPRNSDEIKMSRNSSCTSPRIEDHLFYPATPERKGTKQKERLPYAIASKRYQDILGEKKKMKETLEQQKNERKRKREVTKNEKIKKLTIKCSVCQESIRSKVVLSCEDCNKTFHKKCVPRKHHIHIPEEDDLFLCHNCYKPESQNDAMGDEHENNTEWESTENEELNSDEEDEMDALYEMYKKHTKI